jgi:hypothetical protein
VAVAAGGGATKNWTHHDGCLANTVGTMKTQPVGMAYNCVPGTVTNAQQMPLARQKEEVHGRAGSRSISVSDTLGLPINHDVSIATPHACTVLDNTPAHPWQHSAMPAATMATSVTKYAMVQGVSRRWRGPVLKNGIGLLEPVGASGASPLLPPGTSGY